MLVLAQVSSMKTSRLGSMLPCRAFQSVSRSFAFTRPTPTFRGRMFFRAKPVPTFAQHAQARTLAGNLRSVLLTGERSSS